MRQTLKDIHSELGEQMGKLSLAITRRSITKQQLIDLRWKLRWAHEQVDGLLGRM